MRIVAVVGVALAFGAAVPPAQALPRELGPADFAVSAEWPAAVGGFNGSTPTCEQPNVLQQPSPSSVPTAPTVDVLCCSWTMIFGESKLVGAVSGRTQLGLLEPQLASWEGSMRSEVVSGTGEYEKASGTGGFLQRQQFAIPSPTDFAPRSPYFLSSALPQLTLGTEDQRMRLRLRGGPVAMRAVLPGATILRSSPKPYRLHLVAPPGSACRAKASRGGRTLAIGRAVDRDRDGTILFRGALAAKLGVGSWRIAAACTSAGGRATAVARVRVS